MKLHHSIKINGVQYNRNIKHPCCVCMHMHHVMCGFRGMPASKAICSCIEFNFKFLSS